MSRRYRRDYAPLEARRAHSAALKGFTPQHGNIVDLERAKHPAPFYLINRPGLRYCEACATHKPRGKRPAVKGWRCDDCLKKAKAGAR